MKKLFFSVCILFLPFVFFSQEYAAQEEDYAAYEQTEFLDNSSSDNFDYFNTFGENSDEDFDDFDSIFFESSDVETAVVTEEPSGKKNSSSASFFIPLTFSGYLSSFLGLGAIFDDESKKASGYFDFYNYLYLNARPDKTFSLKGSILTQYPSGLSRAIVIRELYFDYLFLGKMYITAGKKGTVWGYTRLFSVGFDVSKTEDTLSVYKFDTNILSDSLDSTSVFFRIPILSGTVTGGALYKGTATSISAEDMSYVFSGEFLLGRTSVNLFARKNPSESSDYVKENKNRYKPHLLGIEAKRTIFGADVYAQEISQFTSVTGLKRIFTQGDKNAFTAHLITTGLYRWWDKTEVHFGFNAEYQGEYVPESNNYYNLIFVDAGVKRLGPKKNIKLGVSWNHDFNSSQGYVKPGVIVSGVVPHADWDTGVKYEYGNSKSKVTVGTYLKFSLNY